MGISIFLPKKTGNFIGAVRLPGSLETSKLDCTSHRVIIVSAARNPLILLTNCTHSPHPPPQKKTTSKS